MVDQQSQEPRVGGMDGPEADGDGAATSAMMSPRLPLPPPVPSDNGTNDSMFSLQTPQRPRRKVAPATAGHDMSLSQASSRQPPYSMRTPQRRRLVTRRSSAPSVLKDLNLRCKFKLGKLRRSALMAQLDVDAEFLERYRIMDYSLLLGVSPAPNVGVGGIQNSAETFFGSSVDRGVGPGQHSGGTDGGPMSRRKHQSRMGSINSDLRQHDDNEGFESRRVEGSHEGKARDGGQNAHGGGKLVFDDVTTDDISDGRIGDVDSVANAVASEGDKRSDSGQFPPRSPTARTARNGAMKGVRPKIGTSAASYRSRAGSMPNLDPMCWQEAHPAALHHSGLPGSK
jgi:hypothetical protein